MKKVLLLPFLQMSSGHHQVADSLAEIIQELNESIACVKTDILSYRFGPGEKFVTNLYLYLIRNYPFFYSRLYKGKACKAHKDINRHISYDFLFLGSMEHLLEKEKPDVIVCTHSLPSYLVNRMKQKNRLDIPVINAYTDYFINSVWGISHVDYHFTASNGMKQYLMEHGISPQRIYNTGIPVHPKFVGGSSKKAVKEGFNVLVAGGNLGIGAVEQIAGNNDISGRINYFVLCGRNKELYTRLKLLNNPFIRAVRYISCRKEMERLYRDMDLVLTKPGGVTISECLKMKLPIYLLDPLPGQEEMNRLYLHETGLAVNAAYPRCRRSVEESLLAFLDDMEAKDKHQKRIDQFLDEQEDVKAVIKKILAHNE
ncbi:MGDG synthase family glycosyltransferase [Bacillus sp. T33-2]|uniref:MGDG synthase family glycosyltransferase n=1 Tax=Bacillus sp. T33-2 TaxID=2054168 RepID=UPI0015E11A25|nr:glycosyltransferase [Bacillus sp. T33-2]